MAAHPPFRSFVVALALVVALVGLALSAARPWYAQAEGALLGLAQRLAPADAGPVAWIDTTAPGGGAADRAALAAAVDAARAAGARAIVIAQPLEGPGGGADLERVRAFLQGPDAAADPALRARLQSWAAELDHDARLERALREAGNVALLARAVEDPDDPSARAAATPSADNGLATAALAGAALATAPRVVPPLERFRAAARAVGIEPAVAADADGARRTDALLVGDDRAAAPSLPAAAWLAARGAASDAAWGDGRLQAGTATLAAGADGTWVPWYGPRAGRDGGPPRVAIADVAAGRVPAGTLAGRTVLLAPTGGTVATPAGPRSAGDALAGRIASLETGTYARRPPWAWVLGALLALLAPAYAAFAAARLAGGTRLLVAAGLALALLAVEVGLLLGARLWVPLLLPAIAVVLASLATLGRAAPAADTAPMPVRRPPPRPAPRAAGPATPAAPPRPAGARPGAPSPPGASATATHGGGSATPAAAHASLRDISEQIRARQEEPSRGDVADLLLGRSKRPPKPRLGRYELERELGRGAMGTVYLGRDPNINRVVAVKAIPLAQEFEGDALVEARARFFREAEMAGRLQHAGIVTVHDAGEDGGIAYIAMEYVKGRLLSDFATSDALLPAPQVLEIVARIADALDYAHRQDIVHRDIKPANVIFDPATLDAKITDFGIARLTDSSATRTGVVLGTPSFMAPEQLEGRNVNGRSDLFALGVTLFQLLAGQLPFRADSMTGLMDKIANAPHPPLRTIRPDLPPCVGLIVDRALQKDPAQRFASAGDMARALRACARSLAA